MTPEILLLIAALGGAFIGAIVSGGLLILSHHLQAKRDDRRQQRAFERAARSESLERIKHAVDTGLTVITTVQLMPFGLPITESILADVAQFAVAVNGAQVSAGAIGAEQVLDELGALANLSEKMSPQIDKDGAVDGALIEGVIETLARVEKQYIELKSGS